MSLDGGDGVISDCNMNYYLLSINSSQEVTFLGHHIMVMLGNIVTTLCELDDYYGYTFCWFWNSLETLWG